jgi:peptidoglycan/LPS O-acetylase OafA/YrhL
VTRRDALDVVVPAPPETATTFPLLDSFRAVGAFAVLTTHAAFWSGDYTRNGALGAFLARLDVGVAIFFVLSGFLLTRPYLVRAAAGRPAPTTGRYLWKRALRILPVYAVAVTVALVFIHANRGLSNETRLATALMLNTFVDPANPAGLSHMWSLAVEVTFYLCLPVIMLVAVGRSRTLRPTRVIGVLVVLIAIGLWWHLDGAARAGEHSSGQPSQWLPSYIGWFAIGIGLALASVLHERGQRPGLTAPIVFLGRQPGSCWVLVAGLMLMVSTPLAGPTMLAAPTLAQALTKNVVYGMIGGLIVVTGVFTNPGSSYSRWFGHGIARRLGWISYGIFALHLAVLHFVMWSTGWQLFEGRLPQIWILTVVISVIVAEVVYRVVERPALSLKNLRPPWSPRPERPGSKSTDTSATVSDTSTR